MPGAPAGVAGGPGGPAGPAKRPEPTALAAQLAKKIFVQKPKESDPTLTAFKETISKINNLKPTSCKLPHDLSKLNTKGKQILENFLISLNDIFSSLKKSSDNMISQIETLLEPKLNKLNEDLDNLPKGDQILCIDTIQPFIIHFVLLCVNLAIDKIVEKHSNKIEDISAEDHDEIIEILKEKKKEFMVEVIELVCKELPEDNLKILQNELIKIQGKQFVYDQSYPELTGLFSNPLSNFQSIAGTTYMPNLVNLLEDKVHTGRCGTYTLSGNGGGKAKKRTKKQKKRKQKFKSGKKSKRRKGSRKK
jgi:hypothetical protein